MMASPASNVAYGCRHLPTEMCTQLHYGVMRPFCAERSQAPRPCAQSVKRRGAVAVGNLAHGRSDGLVTSISALEPPPSRRPDRMRTQCERTAGAPKLGGI